MARTKEQERTKEYGVECVLLMRKQGFTHKQICRLAGCEYRRPTASVHWAKRRNGMTVEHAMRILGAVIGR